MSNIDTLKLNNFTFNKSFGQNFIFDQNLLKAIVKDSGIDKNTNVLEIGAGAGTLTKEISSAAKKVVAYEIDENLKPVLEENLKNCTNAQVVFKDILKEDINAIENAFNGEYVIIANLPYYITTPIIFKFLEEAKNLKSMLIMVQAEVANRLTAKENTKDYGAITASLNYRADVKIARIVKRNMFTPAPNVDSAVVKIDFKNKYEIKNTKTLEKLIKSAFHMRRKTLANNLKSDFNFTADALQKLFTDCNLPLTIRGEVLRVSDFVKLSNTIEEYIINN